MSLNFSRNYVSAQGIHDARQGSLKIAVQTQRRKHLIRAKLNSAVYQYIEIVIRLENLAPKPDGLTRYSSLAHFQARGRGESR